ncbi:dimethylsulfonioproprionate lyase family protein [Labrys monachus]|uniref:Mannose-6-phosphate isomerase-like protein (Cupin superfamily) n=1 Tax=Labrys monachus TaxID=217067 RepID=A0ABU0FLZ9_9HYPH|nr:dimethylsulfonioproprionate lyase family protein [Labrys monachus]MDQ0395621.1 mannose-6-phosphate isomerase-like protein (cupin superfamily) [Labrys monachus]
MKPPYERLAADMRAAIARCRSPLADPFLAAWPQAQAPIRRAAAALPVLSRLPQLLDHTGAATADLTQLVVENGDALDWRQTYGAGDFGSAFLSRYGWTEIIGQRGAFASDSIAAGFLMLGPGIEYPFHSHDAEEIYIPLAGTALWAAGPQGWRARPPGDLIHHPSRVPHAMRTAAAPLLALYVWRAGNLTQKSVIEAPQA